MIGAGAIMAMIHSLKTNARPKYKVFSRFKAKETVPNPLKEAVKQKDISPKELQLIKKEIHKNAIQSGKRKLILRLILMLVLLVPIMYYSFRLIANLKTNQEKAAKEYEQKQTEDYKNRQELIIEGFQLLQEQKYFTAKGKFLAATKIDPDDYLLQLGLTTCNIRLCIYEDIYCNIAKESYDNLLKVYGNQPEIKKLDAEYKWIKQNKP